MTAVPLRLHLAALAQQALIVAQPNRDPKFIAASAVEHADALLTALQREWTAPVNPGDETALTGVQQW